MRLVHLATLPARPAQITTSSPRLSSNSSSAAPFGHRRQRSRVPSTSARRAAATIGPTAHIVVSAALSDYPHDRLKDARRLPSMEPSWAPVRLSNPGSKRRLSDKRRCQFGALGPGRGPCIIGRSGARGPAKPVSGARHVQARCCLCGGGTSGYGHGFCRDHCGCRSTTLRSG